ncbi:MAG: [methyl-Co(III) glycine betaine-specific corrinoid protein]--tetrahydrofolate methyltransferase MtgA [Promethearchaeota archaeon]
MKPFKFEQKVVEIGGIKIGGQPGEYPTCMIGSMFYKNHSIMVDRKRGIFDVEKARAELHYMEEVSMETGIPFIVDVVGNSSDNLVKYCEFVADSTMDKHQPFLMDGLTDDIRIPALKQLVEIGLRDRLIYNSIEPKIDEETIETIKDCGVRNAVILAFDSHMLLPSDKIRLIEGWGSGDESVEGLYSKAMRAGVENVLVDVAVLDMPSIGIAGRTIMTVKERLGYPVGCAPSNAIFSSVRLKEFDSNGWLVSLASTCAFLASCGADFILFGPVKYCLIAFLSAAHVDAFNAYTLRRVDRIKPVMKGHPLTKIF